MLFEVSEQEKKSVQMREVINRLLPRVNTCIKIDEVEIWYLHGNILKAVDTLTGYQLTISKSAIMRGRWELNNEDCPDHQGAIGRVLKALNKIVPA